jgi:tRNA pseudouridine38-40 synthase
MRTLKLTLAYDGTNYVGWQRQANGVSIQEVVEDALLPLLAANVTRPPTVAAASRTDAGVHALGQVASVIVGVAHPASAIQRALNVRLPPDIRVVGSIDATPGFHARHYAVAKAYRYRIATTPVLSPFDRHYVWHAPGRRDVDAMRRAASALLGRHDFASFQARGAAVRATVRTIHRLEIAEAAGEIVIEVEGDGFLRHMVRAIVGTLAEVGARSRPVESVAAMLAARDRQAAGATAPAQGLTLVSVRY